MTIRIAWSQNELIWLKAALTLPGYEFICAIDDIASMSGRTISAVRSKANSLQAQEPAPARSVMVPSRRMTSSRPMPISALKQPTKAQLMGAR